MLASRLRSHRGKQGRREAARFVSGVAFANSAMVVHDALRFAVAAPRLRRDPPAYPQTGRSGAKRRKGQFAHGRHLYG
jgi:hypothetical protein